MTAKKSKKPKLSARGCVQQALKFFRKQQKFKQIQQEFNDAKSQFYDEMEDYFSCKGITTFCQDIDSADADISCLVIKRVQKSDVMFYPDKLERALGDFGKEVIAKKYEIADMKGLVSYLKEHNVNPKIFKSFLTISKSVDKHKLERLEELGEITAEQIKGCYTVKHQNPYFTVNIKKGRDDN